MIWENSVYKVSGKFRFFDRELCCINFMQKLLVTSYQFTYLQNFIVQWKTHLFDVMCIYKAKENTTSTCIKNGKWTPNTTLQYT